MYKQYMSSKQHNVTITRSGLIIHPSKHFIGASPDGLVRDDSAEDPQGVVEIKTCSAARDLYILDALKDKGTSFPLHIDKISGCLCLKETDKHFSQCQVLLEVTGRKWLDYVLCTERDIHVE